MLDGIAGLIAAVAGLITAITGLVGMIVVARRTSPKERDEAAERALNPPTQLDLDTEALITTRKRRRPRRGR